MIELNDLHVRLKTGRDILYGVNLDLGSTGVSAIVGPNGAGKTTLLRVLAGRIARSSGTFLINGEQVGAGGEEARRLCGYLPEGAPLYRRLTPAEYLRFVCRARGLDPGTYRGTPEVRRMGLGPVLHREIGGLSQGYKRRVALVGALMGDPPVLLLDEATSGLDVDLRGEFLEMIRELSRDRQVVVTTHREEEVHLLNARVVALDNGTIAHGGPAQHLGSPS